MDNGHSTIAEKFSHFPTRIPYTLYICAKRMYIYAPYPQNILNEEMHLQTNIYPYLQQVQQTIFRYTQISPYTEIYIYFAVYTLCIYS